MAPALGHQDLLWVNAVVVRKKLTQLLVFSQPSVSTRSAGHWTILDLAAKMVFDKGLHNLDFEVSAETGAGVGATASPMVQMEDQSVQG